LFESDGENKVVVQKIWLFYKISENHHN